MTTVTPGTQLVEMASGVYARLHEGLTNGGIIIGDDSRSRRLISEKKY